MIIGLCPDEADAAAANRAMNDCAERGIRCIAVARQLPADSGVWKMEAMLTFRDPPRVDSKDTIDKGNNTLRNMEAMLTLIRERHQYHHVDCFLVPCVTHWHSPHSCGYGCARAHDNG